MQSIIKEIKLTNIIINHLETDDDNITTGYYYNGYSIIYDERTCSDAYDLKISNSMYDVISTYPFETIDKHFKFYCKNITYEMLLHLKNKKNGLYTRFNSIKYDKDIYFDMSGFGYVVCDNFTI